jgi:hypothetical protein
MYDLGVRGAQATEVFVLDDTLDFDELGYMICNHLDRSLIFY